MEDRLLLERTRELRAAGRTPKQVARILGIPSGEAARLVRLVACENELSAPEPAVVGCWVSPGWRAGLEAPADWPDVEVPDWAGAGIVSVLVAREHRHGKVVLAAFLVDVFCLGVKDVLGPRVMNRVELSSFVSSYFLVYGAPAVAAPVEVGRELVWGAVAYARGLGFEPHPELDKVAGVLGEAEPTGAVRFGRDGKPFFVEGISDDPRRVMRTLERSVGAGNFHYSVAV
jgi:hypothetical protein